MPLPSSWSWRLRPAGWWDGSCGAAPPRRRRSWPALRWPSAGLRSWRSSRPSRGDATARLPAWPSALTRRCTTTVRPTSPTCTRASSRSSRARSTRPSRASPSRPRSSRARRPRSQTRWQTYRTSSERRSPRLASHWGLPARRRVRTRTPSSWGACARASSSSPRCSGSSRPCSSSRASTRAPCGCAGRTWTPRGSSTRRRPRSPSPSTSPTYGSSAACRRARASWATRRGAPRPSRTCSRTASSTRRRADACASRQPRTPSPAASA